MQRGRAPQRVRRQQPLVTNQPCVIDRLLALVDKAISISLDISGLTPTAALNKLQIALEHDSRSHAEWASDARIVAIMGSCCKSHKSFRSGINNWLKFADVALGGRARAFPPTLDAILAWSLTHRCVGTWSNYVGHLRTACLALDMHCPPPGDVAILKAKSAIVKRLMFEPRPKMFLQRSFVLNIMMAAHTKGIGNIQMAMLCLFAYEFLSRVPSEALPVTIASEESQLDYHSAVWLNSQGQLCLRLKTRKNRQTSGSLLKRKCKCAGSCALCPVHTLWKYLAGFPVGSQPFASISAGNALVQLRTVLGRLGVPSAKLYCLKDFRRGHAKDLQLSGAPLSVILRAGEWKSAAFLTYLDGCELERDAVLEAALLSDDEAWID